MTRTHKYNNVDWQANICMRARSTSALARNARSATFATNHFHKLLLSDAMYLVVVVVAFIYSKVIAIHRELKRIKWTTTTTTRKRKEKLIPDKLICMMCVRRACVSLRRLFLVPHVIFWCEWLPSSRPTCSSPSEPIYEKFKDSMLNCRAIIELNRRVPRDYDYRFALFRFVLFAALATHKCSHCSIVHREIVTSTQSALSHLNYVVASW